MLSLKTIMDGSYDRVLRGYGLRGYDLHDYGLRGYGLHDLRGYGLCDPRGYDLYGHLLRGSRVIRGHDQCDQYHHFLDDFVLLRDGDSDDSDFVVS